MTQTQNKTSDDVGALLQARALSRVFNVGAGLFKKGKALKAVADVDLDVRRGECLGIAGESGSGKTTLSRLLLGLEKPTHGSIAIEGRDVLTIDRRELARKIQPIFQDPYSSLNPRKTIGQIIRMPLDAHKIGTDAQRRQDIEKMMWQVGLSPRLLHAYPNQLSGGQRQRVAIARALIIQPEIVVCDEPTSALDVSVQAQILNLLQDLRASLNLTYVFITHDLGVLDYMADRVAIMYMGRIVELGPQDNVLKSPKHPYTQALISSILTPDPRLGLPKLDLAQGFPDPLNPPSGCAFHPRCAQAREICMQVSPTTRGGTRHRTDCHLYPLEEGA